MMCQSLLAEHDAIAIVYKWRVSMAPASASSWCPLCLPNFIESRSSRILGMLAGKKGMELGGFALCLFVLMATC